MISTKNQAIAAACAAVVLLGGGWMYAKHQATAAARDQIDGFLVRRNLSGQVSYTDVSASPFGTATISGVEIKSGPRAPIKIASLDVSDLNLRGDKVYGIHLAVNQADFPVLDMARDDGKLNSTTAEMLGLGYKRLVVNALINFDYDDKKEALEVEMGGDLKDAGKWKAKVRLSGLDPMLVNTLYNLPEAQANGGALGLFATAMQGMGSLTRVAIAEVTLMIDNKEYHDRQREITSADYPTENTASTISTDVGEAALVRAGMIPSQAKNSVAAFQSWLRDGGVIHLATSIDRPLPLLKPSNGLMPALAFDSPASFLAAAKMQITN